MFKPQKSFIQQNAFENVICKVHTIFVRPQCSFTYKEENTELNTFFYFPLSLWILLVGDPEIIIHKKRHDMEIISTLLAFCEYNPLVTGGFPYQSASNKKLGSFPWCTIITVKKTVYLLVIQDAIMSLYYVTLGPWARTTANGSTAFNETCAPIG